MPNSNDNKLQEELKRKDLVGNQQEDEQEDDYDDDEAARKAGKGCLVAFASFLAVAILAVGIGYFYISGEINGKKSSVTEETVEVQVPAGSAGRAIGTILKDAGLISNENIFRFYVRFNDMNRGFQSGTFHLKPGMSYDELINVLSQAPEREVVRITFPEGSPVIRFGEILQEQGVCTIDEFVDEANNGDFSDIEFFARLQEDYDPNTFMLAEGYLAPDTYEFYKDESVHNIVRKLYEHFDLRMQPHYERMDELNLSLRETITLASLIEEEAGDPANQKPVSQVFWNRIRGDWPQGTLGSDVTFRYIQDWVAREYNGKGYAVVPDELDYKAVPKEIFYAYYTGDEDASSIKGLTAGPISCPGASAIEAALYPDENYSQYYYFLTDYYGKYYYAVTYQEHEKNVQIMEQKNAEFEAEESDS